MINPLNKMKYFWLAFLLFLTFLSFVWCGLPFNKKKSTHDTSTAGERIPANWDGISDWVDGPWKIKGE